MRALGFLALFLGVAAPLGAQTVQNAITPPPLQGRSLAQDPDRGGFTVLVDAGVGIQQDALLEETAFGLGGLNVGVGGFINPNMALMFRIAGTNVHYDFGGLGNYNQVSGVTGGVLQIWLSNRVNVEVGGGLGFWSGGDDTSDTGGGLILGAGFTVFNRGKHNLQIGVQYAPAFTDPGSVQNISFTFGYQFL